MNSKLEKYRKMLTKIRTRRFYFRTHIYGNLGGSLDDLIPYIYLRLNAIQGKEILYSGHLVWKFKILWSKLIAKMRCSAKYLENKNREEKTTTKTTDGSILLLCPGKQDIYYCELCFRLCKNLTFVLRSSYTQANQFQKISSY